MTRICSVETCNNKHHAKGYCWKHYLQIQIHGEILKRTMKDANEFVVQGSVCRIFLYNKQCQKVGEAIIDTEDLPKVRQYKWRLMQCGKVTSMSNNIFLHHVVYGKKVMLDHKNHKGSDNRKRNLRLCDHSLNAANSYLASNNSSGFKGVAQAPHGSSKKWRAYATLRGKQHHLGLFDDIVEAAKSYNKKAKEFFGEFALLNNV